MISKNDCTGIILAGGKGSRLGLDKGLLTYHGMSFLERSYKVLSACCSRVMVSSSNIEYRNLGFELIPDIKPGNGPMMGIYSCLMVSSTRHNMVLAVDNVNVTEDYFTYVISKLHHTMAAVPFIQDKFYEPLAGYYNKGILPEMQRFLETGNYKLPDLLNKVAVLKLRVEKDFPGFHPAYFKSVNFPEDLLLLE